ncbi:MKRN2 opposite strand protein isoform X2 [Strix aluco]|uniref:MKRN2 opposite strand protein isoform X2 n=1 Tax=Strix aluco TaxID=111821 RepID=UPI003DA59AE0
MAEAAILRVRHCGADIFCRRAPPRCPACGRPLRGAGLLAAPVRLPCPFRHGHRQPCAFLLRPSAGTFLGGYDGKSDLHVGITNSNGVVYNYNEEGIHRSESGWEQCISIPLVQPDMFGLLQQWDKLLEEFSVGEAWLPHRRQNFNKLLPEFIWILKRKLVCILATQHVLRQTRNRRILFPASLQLPVLWN